MLSGIVYHASLVIGPSDWLYISKYYSSDYLWGGIHVLHYFRMESFFLLSGFFSALVINKKSYKYYIQSRVKRVLVPLLVALIFITPMQTYYLYSNDVIASSDIYLLRTAVSHLWFLPTLFVLSMILVFIPSGLIESVALKLSGSTSNIFWFLVFVLLVFLAYVPRGINFTLDSLIANEYITSTIKYLLTTPLKYSPLFFLGAALYLHDAFRKLIIEMKGYLLMTAFLIAGVFLTFINYYCATSSGFTVYSKIAMVPFEVICGFSGSLFLFNIFYKSNVKCSKITSILVESSLIVYIFHHPVLLVLSSYFDVPNINLYVYFAAICLSTYAISFLVYLFILRIKFLHKFLGGWQLIKKDASEMQ